MTSYETVNTDTITFAKVNLDNLKHNFSYLKKLAGGAQMMPMIKAQAYGHGILPVAKCLVNIGTNYLGVAFLEEGVVLRKAGIAIPIMVAGGMPNNQISSMLDYDLELTVSSIEQLKLVQGIAVAKGVLAKVHLKIDTGMARVGVHWQVAKSFIDQAFATDQIQVQGIYSHFAFADEPQHPLTLLQLSRFLALRDYSNSLNYQHQPLFHIANSAGIVNFPDSCLDLVRPGICLYGCYPSNDFHHQLDLKPVLSLHSQVVYSKEIPAGTGVSYCHSWISEESCQIATIPVGYGHGYLRSLTNKSQVLIDGNKYPAVGNICMDQFMVNCGNSQIAVGQEVILLGESITAEELARSAGTISYEILTNLNNRIPRIYTESSS